MKTILNVDYKKGKSTPKTILVSLKVDNKTRPLFCVNFLPTQNDIQFEVSIFDSCCEELESGNVVFEYNGVRKVYKIIRLWLECISHAPEKKLLQAIFNEGIEYDFVEL